jgi:osmoprotectant transport system substrate-binding protein
VASTACTSGPAARTIPSPGNAIRVASFAFPESVLLANLYAAALRARGYPVELMTDVGSREIVEPALTHGLIDLVPEYAGSALAFVSLGRSRASRDTGATFAAVAAAFASRGIRALQPAPAQDANAIVVTASTAGRYHLSNVSDLLPVAPHLVFGGPPECPQRPLCLLGLRRSYGLRFHGFVGLDTGGPLTVQALQGEDIDVGLLFSTDPLLASGRLVALADDRDLQPAENVMPVVREAALARFGEGVAETVDAVSARLTTDGLRALEAGMSGRGRSAAQVAMAWLHDEGLD